VCCPVGKLVDPPEPVETVPQSCFFLAPTPIVMSLFLLIIKIQCMLLEKIQEKIYIYLKIALLQWRHVGSFEKKKGTEKLATRMKIFIT